MDAPVSVLIIKESSCRTLISGYFPLCFAWVSVYFPEPDRPKTAATYFLLSAKPEYNIVSDIQKIKQENSLNKDDLMKILELKKKNYERLRGDKDEHIER